MAMYAPETPTLDELEARFPLDMLAEAEIERQRALVGDCLTGRTAGLVAVIGPCAMTLERSIIDVEGDRLYQAQQEQSGLITLHRMPPWKPRSNPNDWHGLESEPDTVVAAYETIAARAAATGNVAIEIGHIPHIARYGRRIALGWSGSRNAEDDALIEALATHDHTLPIGVKNGMDGTIGGALAHVDRINELRGDQGMAAPAVLIYRGGTNAKTPQAWERGYRAALEATDGRMVLDTAHGGEMAFDPKGNYGKSVAGQEACLDRVLAIAARHGEMPAGLIMEASEAHSPTDPVMPQRVALDGARYLCELRMSVPSGAR